MAEFIAFPKNEGNTVIIDSSYLATRARLLNTLKTELEAEARGKNLSGQEKGFRETNASRRAEAFLERMRRMEDRV